MKRYGIILAVVFTLVLVSTFSFSFAAKEPPGIGYGMCCSYQPPGCSSGDGVYDWVGDFLRCTCVPNDSLANITQCTLNCPVCW